MKQKYIILFLITSISFCHKSQTLVCANFSTGTYVWGDSVETNPVSTYGGTGDDRAAEVDYQKNLDQTVSGFLIGQVYILTFQCSRRTTASPPSSTDINIRINYNSLNKYLVKVNSTFNFQTYSYAFTANASTLNLRITSGVLTGNAGTGIILDNVIIYKSVNLPVELTSFTVKPLENNSVLLEWETFTEINNDYFTLEKSINGTEWNVVKIIDGGGDSYSIQDYSYIDTDLYLGTSYYRLRQTDFNGDYSYSEIISYTKKNDEDYLIYPNPTTSSFSIRGKDIQNKSIKIMNQIGQEVLIVPFSSQNEIIEFDSSHLNEGVYTIQTSGEFETFISKLIVI